MKRYKISSGLFTSKEFPFFETDKEAWEEMRKILPGKYVVLYREETVEVSINNREEYLRKHNEKYTSQIIDPNKPRLFKHWVPVIEGLSNDPFSI
jgi:hypothetical protein